MKLDKPRKAHGSEGTLGHSLSHATLAATTASLSGNDALSAALSVGGAEAAAPILAHNLYGKEAQELSAQEKDNIASLAGLLGSAVGASTGNSTNIINSSVAASNAVENNYLNVDENKKLKEIEWVKYLNDSDMQEYMDYLDEGEKERLEKTLNEYNSLVDLSKKRDKEFDDAYEKCRNNLGCKDFYNLHVTQRIEWNKKGVELFKQDQETGNLDKNWKKEPNYKNAFHNFSEDGKHIVKKPDGTYANDKYVSKDGQYEVIVNPKGEIVTQPSSTGTFNYYPAEFGNFFNHMSYDIDPWMDFGSGNGDNTTYNIRHTGIGKLIFGNFSWWYIYNRIKAQGEFKNIDDNNRKR